MTDTKPILYSYYRSSCSARVRIALNLKGIAYEMRPINLVKGEQQSPEYKALNPGGFVPYLIADGHGIPQSVAILEYLEEVYPETPLLPKDAHQRAQVRALMGVICADTQPLQNLKILKTKPESERAAYAVQIIEDGLAVADKMLESTSGKYCLGDEVTLADCCLIPQLYNAHRFGVDMDKFPNVKRIELNTAKLDAFVDAHWQSQPDCPEELRK
ncbi:Maleylacetoacetate isomerase [Linderina pennispora]|uniref:Maleylacetoacetate isomerase n=1 Tax=Linderina pennispora TaxID=61395 RepID=A0A1Y1W3S3_9FUNG|nr:Maleylacetoacetate isomerase [Linderina pennispora]ORX67814.1 Maleylacetoacetate isomerase [Linderina pennispora]